MMISVIVPIYNVERYLQQCIDSILNQTYRDLEIILVDDGSSDNCGMICDNYKKNDSRIRVIHKLNGGLSDARNTGLATASGEYVCFIDSDDYINPHMFEIMISKGNEADIIICNKKDLYKERINAFTIIDSTEIEIMKGIDAFKHFLLEDKEGYVVAWNKLYRRNIFIENNIRYPVGKIHEDCFTTYKTFLAANKVVYIDMPLYVYRHREGSIMSNKNIEKDMSIIDAYDQVLQMVKAKYIDLEEMAEYRYIISNLFCASRVMGKENQKYLVLFKENIKKTNWKKNKYLKGQKKARVYLLLSIPNVYKYSIILMNIVKRY
ncbi:MAG: glycosyltransferase [Roseburia sp.]|nr:glycosyltransferase [Roseburia sp.]